MARPPTEIHTLADDPRQDALFAPPPPAPAADFDPGDFTDEGPVSRHRRFFTTNPSVYRASLCERGWPQEPHSEGVFTHRLLADGFDFAFWGGRFDPPAVTHIGAERTGRGY